MESCEGDALRDEIMVLDLSEFDLQARGSTTTTELIAGRALSGVFEVNGTLTGGTGGFGALFTEK